MSKQDTLRRIQVKRTFGMNWEWVESSAMDFDAAVQRAAQIVEEDESIYAIQITRMTKHWTWVEEFSGDREFNYIGVEV